VSRVSEIRARGRIVLHIDAFRSDVSSPPDLPPEGGDDFVVPLILRWRLWGGLRPEFTGDTIAIPEQLNKTTLLRGPTDWSAVFSQFALGAAAVKVIR
jgi:hypothetical protein